MLPQSERHHFCQNGHEDIYHSSHEQLLWTGVIRDKNKNTNKKMPKDIKFTLTSLGTIKYHKATNTTFLHCINNRGELQTNSTTITESSEGSKCQISKVRHWPSGKQSCLICLWRYAQVTWNSSGMERTRLQHQETLINRHQSKRLR